MVPNFIQIVMTQIVHFVILILNTGLASAKAYIMPFLFLQFFYITNSCDLRDDLFERASLIGSAHKREYRVRVDVKL